jgi:hypothetical protein
MEINKKYLIIELLRMVTYEYTYFSDLNGGSFRRTRMVQQYSICNDCPYTQLLVSCSKVV